MRAHVLAVAAVLRRIGGGDADRDVADIRASLVPGPALVLRRSALRRPLTISVWLAILIHLCGINTVIDYAPTIFRSAGFTMDAALFSTFVVGVANFAFTLISFATIDRFGRRPLYLVGSIGMGVMLSALVGCVLVGQFRGLPVLVLIVGYLLFFASCIGPVFWTLLPEIFPNDVRAAR